VSEVLARWNGLPLEEAARETLPCCGSRTWAASMASKRPIQDEASLVATSDTIWRSLGESDWLEAFRSHPQIGASKPGASKGPESNWSKQEQSGISSASGETVQALGKLNLEYEEKFGFIFIICATGKTSDEMLGALRKRLGNPGEKELHIAAAEQAKITALRLEKLLNQ